MATAEQIKALVRSHVDHDEQRFYSTTLQVAAKEARSGHTKLASDLKTLIENAHPNRSKKLPIRIPQTAELNGLLELSSSHVRMSELVLADSIKSRLEKVLFEQRQKETLAKYGLHPQRKILFTGSPGTGKTMSASVIATELKVPLYTIVLDNLITRYMGETAAKLRLIFDHIKQTRAVYLFDEFDAIGAQRGTQNDVGEIRRVLNSFLMFVEQDQSESIIVAATNHPEILDRALYRRFDDIIEYKKPEKEQIQSLVQNSLSLFNTDKLSWETILEGALGLSAADVSRACHDAAKEAVLIHNAEITTELLVNSLEYRKNHNKYS